MSGSSSSNQPARSKRSAADSRPHATESRPRVFHCSMETEPAGGAAHLTRALARDLDGSFERLVLAHQDRLYTIALRMLGDSRDAEEVTQDALVRAYRALGSYNAQRIHRPQRLPQSDATPGAAHPAARRRR
ncbi:MAG: hypothetical protein E6J17_09045 [Chloroflexi bacterium]|nr:MAG: hypothetical protein E6J17_09045 [Chloroflexota bacterium]